MKNKCTSIGEEKIIRYRPKILPNEGYPLPIDKEKAWIVWIEDEEGRIEDLEIYDVGFKDSSKWEGTHFRIDQVMKNRKSKTYFDIGCSFSDWKKWRLIDLFFKFGFQHKYVDDDIKLYVMNCLGYIKEFEKEILSYQNYLDPLYV